MLKVGDRSKIVSSQHDRIYFWCFFFPSRGNKADDISENRDRTGQDATEGQPNSPAVGREQVKLRNDRRWLVYNPVSVNASVRCTRVGALNFMDGSKTKTILWRLLDVVKMRGSASPQTRMTTSLTTRAALSKDVFSRWTVAYFGTDVPSLR